MVKTGYCKNFAEGDKGENVKLGVKIWCKNYFSFANFLQDWYLFETLQKQ